MDPGWIEAIATFTACGVAVWGINSWRAEKRGGLESDTALRVVKVTITAESAFNGLRVALEAARDNPVREAGAEAVDRAVSELRTVIDAIAAEDVEVEAMWGEEDSNSLSWFANYLRYLAYVADAYATHLRGGALPLDFSDNLLDERLMKALDGEEEALDRLEAHVAWFRRKIESWAKPYLRRDETLSFVARYIAPAEPRPEPERLYLDKTQDYVDRLFADLDNRTNQSSLPGQPNLPGLVD